MASTRYPKAFSTGRRSSIGLITLVIPIPHVFVYPPADDEDFSEPWLCFDPNHPFDDPSDEFDDYDGEQDFEMESILDMHMTGPPVDSTRALVEALVQESTHHQKYVNREDSRQVVSRARPEDDVGNDSEVIEVVKVRRSSEDTEPSSTESHKSSQRPKGIFARAFSSIRKAAKPAKPAAQDVLSTTAQPSASSGNTNNSASRLKRKISTRSTAYRQSSGLSRRTSTVYRDSNDQDQLSNGRPSSPSPSTFSTRTSQSAFGRRFSVLSLQKLFRSPSTADLSQEPVAVDERTDSSSSSSPPRTPVHDTFPLPSLPALPFDSGKPITPIVVAANPSISTDDPDYEMRLDSLHFDSIAFDPSQFR